MIRKVIKINEEGKEMLNEDGSFVFEEIEIDEVNEIEANRENPNKIDSELLKELTKTITNEVKKSLNITDPLKKVEQKSFDKTEIKISTGFNPSHLKKGDK